MSSASVFERSVTATLIGGRGPASPPEIALVKKIIAPIMTGVINRPIINVFVLAVSIYSRCAILRILCIACSNQVNEYFVQGGHLYFKGPHACSLHKRL